MDLTVENGVTKAIRVDMGEPILTAAEVPSVSQTDSPSMKRSRWRIKHTA